MVDHSNQNQNHYILLSVFSKTETYTKHLTPQIVGWARIIDIKIGGRGQCLWQIAIASSILKLFAIASQKPHKLLSFIFLFPCSRLRYARLYIGLVFILNLHF